MRPESRARHLPRPQPVGRGGAASRIGPLAIALAAALAGCDTDQGATPAPADATDADIVVEAREDRDGMRFDPAAITVGASETVTVELRNAGSLRHDLVLDDGTDSGRLNPDESAVVEIGPLHASTVAWCSVPGHRNAGMELDVTVEE